MFNQYLKALPIKNRIGVITSVDIPARIPICEFGGKCFTEEQLKELGDRVDINNVLQVGPNLYLGPSGGVDDHIAHSCNPNCFIHASGRRAILYSLYMIAKGSEITFDYSTTSTDDLDSWKMQCNCGSYNCRKVISGFYHLSPSLQEEYKNKGLTALFIKEKIFLNK